MNFCSTLLIVIILFFNAVYLQAINVKDSIVRVAVAVDKDYIKFSSDKSFRAVDTYTQEAINLRGGKVYKIFPTNSGGLKIEGLEFNSQIRLVSDHDKIFLNIDGRKYRDTIVIKNISSKLTVINELGIDGYLFGVLPAEVSPKWPIESLKAQAIVSRTYVLAHLGKHEDKGYDLSSDVFSQVYKGVNIEDPRTNRAVNETKGLILSYNNKLAKVYFHSSCGSYTADVKNVWGSEIKYLRTVSCPYCKESPRYKWEQEVNPEKIRTKLQASAYKIGKIKKLKVLSRYRSGRVKEIAIYHSKGKTAISGHKFRMSIGPDLIKSTVFAVKRQKTGFLFYGRGWGHGVGMCQWGARGQARRGKNFKRILKFYFPGTKLLKYNY